jgi:hypothetical protein
MDKELRQLQKRAIELLIDYQLELEATKNLNQLKKTRRVASSVAMNIAAFPDLVEEFLSAGVSKKDMSKGLRNFQERLLKDIVRIKGTETGHHEVQLRTGGDFYKGPIEVWQPTLEKLSDFFETEFGDSAKNIRSYINLAHKSDTNTKGLEFAAIGATANPFKELTAHVLNTNAKEIVGNLTPEQLSDPKKLFNVLSERIDFQKQALKNADKVQQKIISAVRSFAGPEAYLGGIEEAKSTQLLTALPENQQTIINAIKEAYSDVLKYGAGSARLSFGLEGVGEFAKTIRKNPLGATVGAAQMVEPEAVKSLFQGKPMEALKQTGIGAVTGALVEQGTRLASPLLSKIPGAGAVGSVLGPAAGAYGGYQLADAILEGATGEGYVGTIQQVQDKQRTAEINRQMQQSAEISRQKAIAEGKPDPMQSSDVIEKIVTDPLNELEYAGKQILGGLKAVGGAILFGF